MIKGTVPTVKIKDPNNSESFIIINKSNFDPKKHLLFEVPRELPEQGEPGGAIMGRALIPRGRGR